MKNQLKQKQRKTEIEHYFYPRLCLVNYEEIGCFQDDEPRAMSVLYTVDAANAIAQCRDKAHAAGYKVFGVQFSTQCYTGPHAHITYDKYGKANNCQNGKGGERITSVYRIIKGMVETGSVLSVQIQRMQDMDCKRSLNR